MVPENGLTVAMTGGNRFALAGAAIEITAEKTASETRPEITFDQRLLMFNT
jgi:hypothetical protein